MILSIPKIKMQLYPFQQKAVDWLIKKNGRALIWSATGTGKTIIALAYAQQLPADARVLIICPASIKFQWQNECRKFYNIESTVIQGTPKQRLELWKKNCKYKIVNYELILKDFKIVSQLQFDLIICDEAHRLQNATAKSVKAIKKLNTRHKIGMSATFQSNGLHELFSPIDWLSPGCLGQNWWHFRNNFCVLLPQFPKIVSYRNLDVFHKIVDPQIYTIGKEVLTDLPPITENIVPFELNKEERKVYDTVKNELRIQLLDNKEITIPNALVAMIRLRQVVNTCYSFGLKLTSSKLTTLVDLMNDLMMDKSNKVLIFTSFAQTAQIYFGELRKTWGGEIITGQTPTNDRQIRLEQFNNNVDCRFLLGTNSLCEGLNIQSANIIIFIDSFFSYGKMSQAIGRAWRNGQKRHVQVYHLNGLKTIDEKIYKLVQNKKEQAQLTFKDINDLLT